MKFCTSVPARGKPDKDGGGLFNAKEKQIKDELKFFVCRLFLVFIKTFDLPAAEALPKYWWIRRANKLTDRQPGNVYVEKWNASLGLSPLASRIVAIPESLLGSPVQLEVI